MLEEYNHLSRVKTSRKEALVYGIYAKDGRISYIAYEMICKKFNITQEARVTLTSKTLKDIWLYSSINPLNNKFWLITITDAGRLTQVQYEMLARTYNCVFILYADDYKGFNAMRDSLTKASKKNHAHMMLLNLGYINRYLIHNLVTHYGVEKQVSDKMRMTIAGKYGGASSDVLDMLLQIQVSGEIVKQAVLLKYLGYPMTSIQDAAVEILWFKLSLAEGATARKITNRVRKIYYPCKAYGDRYSYRSLQEKLEEAFKSFINVKTAYLKGTQKQYKNETKDKNIMYSYRRYDKKLADVTLVHMAKCLVELNKHRWESMEDVTLFIQEMVTTVD